MTAMEHINAALAARHIMSIDERDLADAGEYGAASLRPDLEQPKGCHGCGWVGGTHMHMNVECCTFCNCELLP